MSFNKDEYFKGAESLFVSNELLKEIVEFDNTIEVIGYIDEITDVSVVGLERKKLLKFFINNGDGNRLQIKIWESQIDRILPNIKCNQIVHLDGIGSRVCTGFFNKTKIPFEFLFQSNTEINILGEYKLINENIGKIAPLLTFDKIEDSTDNFKIQGFVKTLFTKVINDRSKAFLYISGSITDGLYKLEIRIKQDDGDLSFLKKGEKVEVMGNMNFAGTINLNALSTKDVAQIKGEVMSIKNLLRGCQLVKRPLKEEKGSESKTLKLD